MSVDRVSDDVLAKMATGEMPDRGRLTLGYSTMMLMAKELISLRAAGQANEAAEKVVAAARHFAGYFRGRSPGWAAIVEAVNEYDNMVGAETWEGHGAQGSRVRAECEAAAYKTNGAMQDDIRDAYRACCGAEIGADARSPHQFMQQEIIPRIKSMAEKILSLYAERDAARADLEQAKAEAERKWRSWACDEGNREYARGKLMGELGPCFQCGNAPQLSGDAAKVACSCMGFPMAWLSVADWKRYHTPKAAPPASAQRGGEAELAELAEWLRWIINHKGNAALKEFGPFFEGVEQGHKNALILVERYLAARGAGLGQE